MKVLNLLCAQDHRFEGWFASEADFLSQDEGGLLACPMCGSNSISRLPSAPRLNMSRQRDVAAASVDAQAPAGEALPQQVMIQSETMRAVRHMLANTEDVGDRFPEEARRIHYGEVEERGIRGQATREEAAALAEEGIPVLALNLPQALKGTTH